MYFMEKYCSVTQTRAPGRQEVNRKESSLTPPAVQAPSFTPYWQSLMGH